MRRTPPVTPVTATLPPLRDVIARHGLSASKALGQNFLFDGQFLDRIAAIPGDLRGKPVLEIGPGPGGLTRALLRAGAHVTAYEIWAYVISGVFASIGGILLAARLGRGDIASGNNLLLDAVAAALIGFAVLGAAKPNAFGTTIGALFVGVLLQGLTMMNAPYYTQDFVKGVVLVVALVFTFALSHRGRN